MIFFRNLRNFAADMIAKPDIVVISRAAVPKVCVFPINLMYEHILKNSKVIWDFDDDIFGINEITKAEARLLQKHPKEKTFLPCTSTNTSTATQSQ